MRYSRRWEDNIKIELGKYGVKVSAGLNWFRIGQAVKMFNMVMNFQPLP
jgi:hypothetical protein